MKREFDKRNQFENSIHLRSSWYGNQTQNRSEFLCPVGATCLLQLSYPAPRSVGAVCDSAHIALRWSART